MFLLREQAGEKQRKGVEDPATLSLGQNLTFLVHVPLGLTLF